MVVPTIRRSETIAKLKATKTVSFFGGLCLIINAMTGPAIPFTPQIFSTTGFVIPIILFIVFAVISAFSVLFIIEAMQAIPGNRHFQGTVEFSTLVNFYFNPWLHVIAQLLLYAAIQSQAIQSIVLSAQAMDNMLITIFHRTCGVAWPTGTTPLRWVCVTETAVDSGSPFANPDGSPIITVFTIGILIVAALCVPMGLTNLDNNITMQFAAFILTIVIVVIWCATSFFTVNGVQPSQIPPVAISSGWQSLAGTIMTNMAGTIFVPTWINLKRMSVNAQACVWSSMTVAVIIYVCVGIIPVLGYQLPASGNIIPALSTQFKHPAALTIASCYAFAFVMLMPSIPVCAIVSLSNLTQNNIVSSKIVAVALCFVVPWVAAIPLQTGSALLPFIAWTGMIFVSSVNFIVPFLIYLQCLKFRRVYNENRVLTDNQKNLLKTIHSVSTTITQFIDSGGERPGLRRRRRRPSNVEAVISATAASILESSMTPSRRSRESSASQDTQNQETAEPAKAALAPQDSDHTIAEPAPQTEFLVVKAASSMPSDAAPKPSPNRRESATSSSNSRPRNVALGFLLPMAAHDDAAENQMRASPVAEDVSFDFVQTQPIVDNEPWLLHDVPDPDAEDRDAAAAAASVGPGANGGAVRMLSLPWIISVTQPSRTASSVSLGQTQGEGWLTVPSTSNRTIQPSASNLTSASVPTIPTIVLEADESSLNPSEADKAVMTVTSMLSLQQGLRRGTSTDTMSLAPPDASVAVTPSASAASATGSAPPSISDRTGSVNYDFMPRRRPSLPTHPDFVAPAFRSVPKWASTRGVRGNVVAVTLLVSTTLVSSVSVILYLVFSRS